MIVIPKESSDLSSAQIGTLKLYAREDGLLYTINENGVRRAVQGSGSGGGSIATANTNSIELILSASILTANSKISATAGNAISINHDGLYAPEVVIPILKRTATLQYAKATSITANTVISPATAGSDWQGGANMGQGTHPTIAYKVTSINSTIMRYITNSPGTLTMRLAYVTPAQALAYNAGTGTTIASWTGNIPNTSGSEKFYFDFVNDINVALPAGVIVFVECTNRSMTTCEGISILLNIEEI